MRTREEHTITHPRNPLTTASRTTPSSSGCARHTTRPSVFSLVVRRSLPLLLLERVALSPPSVRPSVGRARPTPLAHPRCPPPTHRLVPPSLARALHDRRQPQAAARRAREPCVPVAAVEAQSFTGLFAHGRFRQTLSPRARWTVGLDIPVRYPFPAALCYHGRIPLKFSVVAACPVPAYCLSHPA